MYDRRFVLVLTVVLCLALAACRGPVRNPEALTPIVRPEGAIAPPTSTVLPSPTPIPTATPVIVRYVVQPGDTLYDIAVKFGTTVDAIRRVNNLPPGAILQVGQELNVPK